VPPDEASTVAVRPTPGLLPWQFARRLGFYRMAPADPPAFGELQAAVASDPGALGAPVVAT
jgi:hypothetical protein